MEVTPAVVVSVSKRMDWRSFVNGGHTKILFVSLEIWETLCRRLGDFIGFWESPGESGRVNMSGYI